MRKYNGTPTRLLNPDSLTKKKKEKKRSPLRKALDFRPFLFIQERLIRPLGRFFYGIAGKTGMSLHAPRRIFTARKRTLPIPDFSFSKGNLFDSVVLFVRKYRLVIGGIVVGIGIAFIVILINDFFRVQALARFQPNITTKIYDKNDILISELFRQKREVVPFERIPDDVTNAFIAIEDQEFYEHNGINIKGIVRAFFVNIFSGRIRQGGSTITQQLSKILLTSRKRNIYRKIKEAFIAFMMEFTYSKEQILDLYLNQIYLGHGTYGIESASRLFYDKHVWELNLAESSLLATLPSAPNLLSPIRHPKRSMYRHRIVLSKMVEEGFITVEEAEKAYLEFWPDYLDYISKISPTKNAWSNKVDEAPWFTEYIRRRLVKEFGDEMVYEKGLQVYTTLDIHKQRAAQELLQRHLERQSEISSSLHFKNEDYIIDNYYDMVNMFSLLFDVSPFRKKGTRINEKVNDYFQGELVDELDALSFFAGIEDMNRFIAEYRKKFYLDPDYQEVEGALISINHRNGYIEAMVGGSEFSSINQLNRVMQARRQPGSSIKPLLYTAAIESKEFTAATAILDSPIVYLDNEGGDWLPENYEGEYYGFVRLRKALTRSINVVSIRIADALGISRVIRSYANILDFSDKEADRRIPRNFSIALGSFEVSPYELTRAYATIANGGRYVLPFSIRYVKDREDTVIFNDEERVREILKEKERDGSIQVISPETAQVMISLLQSVVEAGTGRGASPGRPSAGKTGTTNNWRDAWFLGFVPQLTTGIWIGYDKLGLSLGIGQSGGTVAAPIWGEYMREALSNDAVQPFPVYAELEEHEICERSGLLPSYNCRRTVNEIFVPETAPEDECGSCTGTEDIADMAAKEPRENITRKQKKAIMKNMKDNTENVIIDSIGDDLLK